MGIPPEHRGGVLVRLLRVACVVVVGLAVAGPLAAASPVQVEMDRILARVNGRIITQSDVQQARRLKLVDHVSSDAATLRDLEDRLLILGEMGRAGVVTPPTDAEIAARYAEWRASFDGPAGRLAQEGMTDAELTAWLRDDVRIRTYLQRQFGMLSEADRERAIGDWLGRLHQRANLP
jgi:hypothetical protein